MGLSQPDNSIKFFYEICPLAIPKQISLMSIHIASFVKISLFTQVIVGNENMGMSRADISVKI